MRLQKVVLPAPGWTHHREHLAGGDVEGDVTQHGPSGVVAEGDAFEGDGAADSLQLGRTGRVPEAGPFVDDLEHPHHGPGALLELAVDAGDGGEAGADGDAVEEEAGERTQADGAVDDTVAGEPEQGDERAEAEDEHHRAEQAAIRHQARGHAHDAPQVLAVAVTLPLLAAEGLDHPDTAERFFSGRGRGRDRVLDAGREPAQGPREDDRDDDHRRRQHEDDQEQVRAEQEEHHDGAHEAQHRREQRGQRLREHRAYLGHVAREARDELAHPAAHVEVELERDQAIEDLCAQAGHDALADDAQRPGLGEAGHRQHERDAHEQEQDAVEPISVAGRDHLVDQAADDQRQGQPERGRDQQGDDGHGEQAPVRPQVAEQATPGDPGQAGDACLLGPVLAGFGSSLRIVRGALPAAASAAEERALCECQGSRSPLSQGVVDSR